MRSKEEWAALLEKMHCEDTKIVFPKVPTLTLDSLKGDGFKPGAIAEFPWFVQHSPGGKFCLHMFKNRKDNDQ